MQEPNFLPLIDTHQHLWDFEIVRPGWLRGAGLPLEQSHTPDDYEQAREDLGIVQSVYVEVGVEVAEREIEARYVAGLCADPKCPLVALIAGGDPASDDFGAYLDRLEDVAGPSLRGVRGQFPRRQEGADAEAAFIRGAGLLAARELHFEFLTGPDALGEVTRLAGTSPETRFVVDHCGNVNPWDTSEAIQQWQRGIEALATLPNVAVKVSGLVNRAPDDAFVAGADHVEGLAARLFPCFFHVWEAFGPDRLFWGSDWPVCNTQSSLAEWVQVFRQIAASLPVEHRAALFSGNARRWYRLPDLSGFSG